jgi:hypothetical protein
MPGVWFKGEGPVETGAATPGRGLVGFAEVGGRDPRGITYDAIRWLGFFVATKGSGVPADKEEKGKTVSLNPTWRDVMTFLVERSIHR